MNGEEIKAMLGLEPLPHEGGWWTQTHIDEHSTAIYYFLAAGECSALHRLPHVELYHWYAGSPLDILILAADGSTTSLVLGPDLVAGQRPQLSVPANAWQGSSPLGEWALVGTTMAPGYRQLDFELGDRSALIEQYPEAAPRIRELTT